MWSMIHYVVFFTIPFMYNRIEKTETEILKEEDKLEKKKLKKEKQKERRKQRREQASVNSHSDKLA